METDNYIIENSPIMIIEETADDQVTYDGGVNLQDINENCPLGILIYIYCI